MRLERLTVQLKGGQLQMKRRSAGSRPILGARGFQRHPWTSAGQLAEVSSKNSDFTGRTSPVISYRLRTCATPALRPYQFSRHPPFPVLPQFGSDDLQPSALARRNPRRVRKG
jgi:hypothetical protein